MNAKEKIEELLEASEDGTITAAQVTEAGLHRSVLQEFVKSGEMYRFGRGLFPTIYICSWGICFFTRSAMVIRRIAA